MSLGVIDRYADLIHFIIGGSYYANNGVVVPYNSGYTYFRVETGSPNTEFGIYLNEVFSGTEISDSNGNIVLKRKLPRGEIELILYNRNNGRRIFSYITVREYALWLASYADCLEEIDNNFNQVRDNLCIETADIDGLLDVFSPAISFYNDIGQGVTSYRNQLHELRTSFRNFGGTFKGLEESVAEITQIPPFGYSKRKWGPNWILDQSMLCNYRFLDRSAYLSSTGNITGVELIRVEAGVVSNPITPHELQYDHTNNLLTWVLDGNSGAPKFASDGELFLPGPISNISASLIGRDVSTVIYSISTGPGLSKNNILSLDIDNKGVIDIQLTTNLPNPSVNDVVLDINTALGLDIRYGVAYGSFASNYNGKLLLKSPANVVVPSGSISNIKIVSRYDSAGPELFGNIPLSFNCSINVSGVNFLGLVGVYSFIGNIELEHDYSVVSDQDVHKLRWKSYSGAFGPWVDVVEDGYYNLLDTLLNELKIYVIFDELPKVLGVSSYVRVPSYTLAVEGKGQVGGIFVDIIKSDLPSSSQTDVVIVYDDVTDSMVESPNYWFISPNLPTTSESIFYPSDIISNVFGNNEKASAMSWSFKDTTLDNVDLISHVKKFPLIDGTPRGSNWPQKGSGLFYDYEGFTAKLSGWFKSNNSGAITVTLSFSFDGGNSWVSSIANPITNSSGGLGYNDYTYVEFRTIIPSDILYNETPPLSWTDSGVLVCVNFNKPTGDLDIVADAVNVTIDYISSTYLSYATVSRSRHSQYMGELVWLWSKDELVLNEKKYLGLKHKSVNKTTPMAGLRILTISFDTPGGSGVIEYEYNPSTDSRKFRWVPFGTNFAPGLGWVPIISSDTYTLIAPDSSYIVVDVNYSLLPTYSFYNTLSKAVLIEDSTINKGLTRRISPANSDLHILDVSEYDSSGNVLNLVGSISEEDFSYCGLVNCEIQSTSPFKYSYIYPEFESPITNERLALSLIGLNREAELLYYSDEDQEEAILYENGIPVPNNMWSFIAPNRISIPNSWFISGDLNLSSIFTIDYNLLYQVTTTVFDLGADFQDYMWLADYFLWERFDSNLGYYDVETPLFFNYQTGRSFLTKSSKADKTTSYLYVQEAYERREVPKLNWRFVGDKMVEIDINYMVNGQYLLYHQEKKVYERSRLTATFEHRSGPTEADCVAASWKETEKNSNVSVIQSIPHRYHQMKLSISGIRSLKDFRIRSLVLKGLKIHGSNPYVPSLTNVWGR